MDLLQKKGSPGIIALLVVGLHLKPGVANVLLCLSLTRAEAPDTPQGLCFTRHPRIKSLARSRTNTRFHAPGGYHHHGGRGGLVDNVSGDHNRKVADMFHLACTGFSSYASSTLVQTQFPIRGTCQSVSLQTMRKSGSAG